ncbi:MAG: L,D-transpeptidase [Acidimicrobiia bacterium]|nr:L,D-transpeptidase [Acidimicrobiia bacterium]
MPVVRTLLPALGLLLAACGGLDRAAAETFPPTTIREVPPSVTVTTAATPAVTTTPSATAPPTTPPAESRATTWTAARAEGRLAVFRNPESSRPFRVLETTTILGTPTVVFVLDVAGDWLEVMVPGRPNGQTGWVRQADVAVFEVATRAVVDLATRTLEVFEGDRKIFETAIGVGSPASPTPTGMFFVTDAVRLTRPGGPWGPYAFGLSARSDSVTEFNGGDGIIGIHGTNRPASIGEAQSLGCVRVPNDAMLELAELLAVGSPVTIRA